MIVKLSVANGVTQLSQLHQQVSITQGQSAQPGQTEIVVLARQPQIQQLMFACDATC